MLTTPRLRPINVALDAKNSIEFIFDSVGGDQIFANELEIYELTTNQKVYDNKVNSFAFKHIVNEKTLVNGRTYKVRIKTFNHDGDNSNWSDFIVLKCLSEPTLVFTNLGEEHIIKNQTYLFTGKYSQSEGDKLKSYKFILYDNQQRKISISKELFDGKLEYDFTGLQNDEYYYVEIKIKTESNMEATTGLQKIYVKYIQPRIKNLVKLENDSENAKVNVEIRAIQVIFKPLEGEYKYIDGEWVDLTNGSIYTNSEWGFDLWNGNWTLDMRVKLLNKDTEFFKMFDVRKDYITFEKWKDRVFFRYYYKKKLFINVPFDISNLYYSKDDTLHIWLQKEGIGFRHKFNIIKNK